MALKGERMPSILQDLFPDIKLEGPAIFGNFLQYVHIIPSEESCNPSISFDHESINPLFLLSSYIFLDTF
jgi:hypothetical protein